MVEAVSVAGQYGGFAHIAAVIAHTDIADASQDECVIVLGERAIVLDPRTPPRGCGRGELLGHLGVQDLSEGADRSIVGGSRNI